MYGPVDGAGDADWSFAGVLAGTGAANSVARMFSKSPCGEFSLTVITPVESFAVMPLIPPVLVLPNWSAPTMLPKKPTPGESTLKSRSIDDLKSVALTGDPSEYLIPLRSVIVYVLPPSVTFGRSCARYGTMVAPSGPLACL